VVKPFFKNKYFYIAASLTLVILCISGWFILSDSNQKDPLPDPEERLTSESLSNRDLDNLKSIKDQGNKIKSKNDTIEGTACNCKIVIKDSLIADLIPVPVKAKQRGNGAGNGNDGPRQSPNSNQQTVENNSGQNDSCGEEIRHPITSKDRGLSSIENKYKVKCDSITVEYLKQMNGGKEDIKIGDTLKFKCLCTQKKTK